jgi:hypothetical protein
VLYQLPLRRAKESKRENKGRKKKMNLKTFLFKNFAQMEILTYFKFNVYKLPVFKGIWQ